MNTDNLILTVDSTNYANLGVHNPTTTISLVDFPSITITTSSFELTLVDCTADTFSFTWPDGTTDLGQVDHGIERDSV